MKRSYDLGFPCGAPPILPPGLELSADGRIITVDREMYPWDVTIQRQHCADGLRVLFVASERQGGGRLASFRWQQAADGGDTAEIKRLEPQPIRAPLSVYVAGSFLRRAEIAAVISLLQADPDVHVTFDWPTESEKIRARMEFPEGVMLPDLLQSQLGIAEIRAVSMADLLVVWLPGRLGVASEVGVALGSRMHTRGSPAIWLATTTEGADIPDQPFYRVPEIQRLAKPIDDPAELADLIIGAARRARWLSTSSLSSFHQPSAELYTAPTLTHHTSWGVTVFKGHSMVTTRFEDIRVKVDTGTDPSTAVEVARDVAARETEDGPGDGAVVDYAGLAHARAVSVMPWPSKGWGMSGVPGPEGGDLLDPEAELPEALEPEASDE